MRILENLSKALLMKEADVKNFALTSPYRYKKYEIPKRGSDQVRVIAHPSKELKVIQRALVKLLIEILPIHDCAYAYRKGVGIKQNADQHRTSKYLLKMDFKDFFPSITPSLLFSTLRENSISFDKNDEFILENIIFWRPKRNGALELSVGAPSSPLISNFIMYRFDEKIRKECDSLGVVYTRYADDITFSTSTENQLRLIPPLVQMYLTSESENLIQINSDKTKYSSKKYNRHITGIVITNDNTISVGRVKKRNISAMIHKFSYGELSEKDVNRLKGLLAYVKHIEPNFRDRMIEKYGNEIMGKLIKVKEVQQGRVQ